MTCRLHWRKCRLHWKKTCLFPHFCFATALHFRSLSLTDSCRKAGGQPIPPSLNVRYLTVACTRTQPQGELSVTVLRIGSNCPNLIFQALSNPGPACLSDFSSWAALVIQSPRGAQRLTSSVTGPVWSCVCSCFCDFVPSVSSTWIIPLSLLGLAYTHSSFKALPDRAESVQIPLSDTTDATNG